jgi:hypothetical protein
MRASVITPNKPITKGQLVDMRTDFKEQASAAERRRSPSEPYGFAYAEQRYWRGRVDLLSNLIEQLGDLR